MRPASDVKTKVTDTFAEKLGVKILLNGKMREPMTDQDDFSVVVKNRAPPPKPWRWEIYRAGRTSAIEHSAVFFESMTKANRAGKRALSAMLSECPD